MRIQKVKISKKSLDQMINLSRLIVNADVTANVLHEALSRKTKRLGIGSTPRFIHCDTYEKFFNDHFTTNH